MKTATPDEDREMNARQEIIALLESEMPRLLAVWEGTANAGEILEDVCNTLGHAIRLEPPQLRKLWQRIESAELNGAASPSAG